MFDLLPMLLSSVASFLFPIFASYKALKTHDPAELTPWLMYWVVISCFLLAESWVWFIVSWIPFYGYFRLLFLLYLILPQTQGARYLYEEKVHPFLTENESQIDEFITSAHNRLTDAGIAYLKLAIEAFKTKVLGLPPSEPTPPPTPQASGPQSYTQSLLSRFSVPAANWTGAANPGSDFYSLLSSAVAAATTSGATASGSGATSSTTAANRGVSNSGALIPPHLRDSTEKMTFISAQRDRLNIVLSALDREAQGLRAEAQRAQERASTHRRAPSMTFDGTEDDDPTQRPSSVFSGLAGLTKSRSEADFEQIDAESGTEDDGPVRRRNVGPSGATPAGSSSWAPWGWGGGDAHGGTSSGAER
ncbi:TB2/DP1, HVA22 family-domain-containing protein [Ilyonectria robusta]|uniref:TB2/DP1, HVA22 family-domain-containing protein n=1 Tax=Ilyonectria robusta TaxID=1079257 RepID=UPI001E8DDE94|nr:TB2/DP1, HVA22 family-domain-containing protein [Ilyonectria robusta]KAH8729261.1 TB2/DP1, HVA22 family-domain-containing protein [Ilyonectria robusta]